MNVFVPNTKEDILKNVRNRTVFLSYYGSPKTAWLQTFFRISSFVFRTNTGLRVSKWWQNFIFVSLISVIILGQLGVRVCRACPSHTVSCSQFPCGAHAVFTCSGTCSTSLRNLTLLVLIDISWAADDVVTSERPMEHYPACKPAHTHSQQLVFRPKNNPTDDLWEELMKTPGYPLY